MAAAACVLLFAPKSVRHGRFHATRATFGRQVAMTFRSNHDGGRGGAAGISTNRSSGPSAAIAHVGAGPVLVSGTTMAHGNGGAAIATVSQVVFNITKTIPATPAGVAQDILAF